MCLKQNGIPCAFADKFQVADKQADMEVAAEKIFTKTAAKGTVLIIIFVLTVDTCSSLLLWRTVYYCSISLTAIIRFDLLFFFV